MLSISRCNLALAIASSKMEQTVFLSWSITSSSPSLGSFSWPLGVRPLKSTVMFPLILFSFLYPNRVLSNLKLLPCLFILYVSWGASEERKGINGELQAKCKSTEKSGSSSRARKICSLCCSRYCYLSLCTDSIKISSKDRSFRAYANSNALGTKNMSKEKNELTTW